MSAQVDQLRETIKQIEQSKVEALRHSDEIWQSKLEKLKKDLEDEFKVKELQIIQKYFVTFFVTLLSY